MIVTRRHLHRRTFLKGMGTVIALPMLDAMTPAFARAAELNKPALRLGFTYVPNGITMNQWTPKGTGAGFEFSRVMKPLAGAMLSHWREDRLERRSTGLAITVQHRSPGLARAGGVAKWMPLERFGKARAIRVAAPARGGGGAEEARGVMKGLK